MANFEGQSLIASSEPSNGFSYSLASSETSALPAITGLAQAHGTICAPITQSESSDYSPNEYGLVWPIAGHFHSA